MMRFMWMNDALYDLYHSDFYTEESVQKVRLVSK